jgi:hypothetical protein
MRPIRVCRDDDEHIPTQLVAGVGVGAPFVPTLWLFNCEFNSIHGRFLSPISCIFLASWRLVLRRWPATGLVPAARLSRPLRNRPRSASCLEA